MYGLSKIITIDSFYTGLRTELELDDHSIISGTNGAGKTSTLKLLTLFYGGEARLLNGKETFVNHYLPRLTSMLIFEYERESGRCCVVVYRQKNTDHHAYRFLGQEFTEDVFSEINEQGKRIYFKGYELKHHWVNKGINHSKQIEQVNEYRRVIQNDRSLNSNANIRKVRQLASQYCLGTTKSSMRYVERICSSIVTREGNMARMKDMLADIMSQSGIDAPKLSMHEKDIRIVDDVNLLRRFEKMVPDMKKLSLLHIKRKKYTENIQGLVRDLLYYEEEFKKDENEALSKINAMDQKGADLRVEWESKYEKLRLQEINERTRHESLQSQINALNIQFDEYQDNDLAQKSSDYDNVHIDQSNLDDLRRRHEDLSDEIKPEESRKNELISDAHKKATRNRKKLQNVIEELNLELNDEKESYQQQKTDLTSEENKDIQEENNQIAEERKSIEVDKAKVETIVQSCGPTDKENAEISFIEGELETLTRKSSDKESELNKKKKLLDEVTKKLDLENQNLSETSRKKELTGLELESLHKLAFAEDGTWLSELRAQQPGWVKNLGKIIHPELLQRRDLHCELVADNMDTIFGWSLDLDQIAPPDFAQSEDQLRAEYQNMSEKLEQYNSDLEKQKSICEKIAKERKAKEQDVMHAQLEFEQSDDEVEAANLRLQEKRDEVRESVSERKMEARNDVKKLEKSLRDLNKSAEQRIQSIRDRYIQSLNEINEGWWNQKSHLTERINETTSQRDRLEQDLKHQIKEIESDYLNQISGKGIDLKVLEDIENKIKKTKDKIAEINSNASEVQSYRDWLKHQWSQREDLNKRSVRANQEHYAITQNIDKEKKSFNNRKEAIQKESRNYEAQLKRVRSNKSDIELAKPKLSAYLKMAVPSSGLHTFDGLIREVHQVFSNLEAANKEVVGGVDKINRNLNQFDGSQIAKAWNASLMELKTSLGFEEMNAPAFILEIPRVIEVFLDKELDSIHKLVIETSRSFCNGLKEFFDKMQGVHSRIKHQSSRFTTSISENLNIDALSSLGIKLTSKIDSLEYWGTLKGFSHNYEKWLEQGSTQLPSQELVEDIGALSDSLQSMKSTLHLRDYFDLNIWVVENNSMTIIRNDSEFNVSSSDGLRYLMLCIIYVSIARELCPDKSLRLHFPIDEIGILHNNNVSRLFELLDKEGITILGGSPNESPAMFRHFKYRSVSDISEGLRPIDIPESRLEKLLKKQIHGGSENATQH